MQRLLRLYVKVFQVTYINLEELQMFIHYTRDLRFDDRPDYGFLKRLIKTVSDREKLDFDYNFDWIIKKQEVNNLD